MLTHFLFRPEWQAYLIPAAGVAAAFLTLALAKLLWPSRGASSSAVLTVSGWVRRMQLRPSGGQRLVDRVETDWR